MTTLQTILREEGERYDDEFGGQKFVYANELTIKTFLRASNLRAVVAVSTEIYALREHYAKFGEAKAVEALDRILKVVLEDTV